MSRLSAMSSGREVSEYLDFLGDIVGRERGPSSVLWWMSSRRERQFSEGPDDTHAAAMQFRDQRCCVCRWHSYRFTTQIV